MFNPERPKRLKIHLKRLENSTIGDVKKQTTDSFGFLKKSAGISEQILKNFPEQQEWGNAIENTQTHG